MEVRKRFLLGLAPWVGAILLWYGVRWSGFVNVSLIPAPHQVAAKFVELLLHEGLLYDIFASTRRVFLGVMLGILVAVPVGFLLGWYRPARTFADPMINFFRALPPIALIPLVIVYFGVDELAKLVILFYASFFAGVIVMYEGISQITPLYIRVAQTLGAGELEIFRKVIIPLTVPHILTALRVALGVAWATLVASELIAAQRGLGALIQNASTYFLLDVIYVGIICIGFVALIMDMISAADQCAPAGLAGKSRRMTAPAGIKRVRSSTMYRCRFDTPKGALGSSTMSATTSMTATSSRSSAFRLWQDDDDEHACRLSQTPTAGGVLFDGAPVMGPGPERGVIFQEYGVFPWLTVKDNIAFGLHTARKPCCRRETRRHLRALQSLMGLADFADSYPKRSREACASASRWRAPTRSNREFLLMDEPFGALDAQTRSNMQNLLLEVLASEGKTVMRLRIPSRKPSTLPPASSSLPHGLPASRRSSTFPSPIRVTNPCMSVRIRRTANSFAKWG